MRLRLSQEQHVLEDVVLVRRVTGNESRHAQSCASPSRPRGNAERNIDVFDKIAATLPCWPRRSIADPDRLRAQPERMEDTEYDYTHPPTSDHVRKNENHMLRAVHGRCA